MFTLTWILCSGALCLGAMTDSELLPIALAAGGLAVGTRTTAIPVVVVMLGATFWLRRRELLQHPLALSIGTATTLGTGVVWYLQDLAVYHAPLYPFSSLPSGPPVPKSISALDANFIHDPAGAIRIAHVSGYAHALGGGLVLILGVLIAAVLLPTVRDRRLRTGIAIAVGFSVAEAVVWSVTPFTGYSGDPSAGLVYVLAGTRYLLPGLAIFAVAVGLASRAGGLLGLAARGVAILGVATDLWALHRVQLGIRPHAAALVAAALVGAVAAVLAGEVRRTRPSDRRPVAPVAPVAVLVIGLSVAMIAVGTAATHGYLDRHIKLVRQLHIDEPDVLAMLERQPRWANGHLPVATGPVADALLAGPTFNHPLSVIAETESCADVRAAAHEGWVVLPSKPAPPPLALTGDESTYDRVRCLADVPAAFTADGLSVFAPTG